MLKCQFHTHVQGDPIDHILYPPKDLIKEAARLKYDALAITTHHKVIFNKGLHKFAKAHNIILIPGIELEIEKKHVLIINATRDTEKIDSFEKLSKYKSSHPDCLIIAPHPFFPGPNSLKKSLIEHIKLFDAIENSFCYTKTKNYNKEAHAIAKRWKLPIIATSDCHILKFLDLGYTMVDAKIATHCKARNTSASNSATKSTTIQHHLRNNRRDSSTSITAIIRAIKANRVTPHHSPISYTKISRILAQIGCQTLWKRISK